MTDALQHLYNRLKHGGYPTAQMGGIYANKPGYHNKRDNLPASDYSCQHPDDRAGSGQWAAGLDVTLNPADMPRMTQQLIDLTFARDPRIQVVREFFGTVNGRDVTGLDVRDVRWVTSDSSHLWHVHLSVFRRWAGDHAAMDALADAILAAGAPPEYIAVPEPEDDDMAFRVYQDPRSPAQWAIGADWALGMANAGQLAVWLSLPDCAEPEVIAIDAAHWDQLLRRVPPARMVASGTLPD